MRALSENALRDRSQSAIRVSIDCQDAVMAQTLEQIAELAGVSRATVSRVINGGPYIRTEVRERVMRVIAEHNFHPNAVARSLARRRTNAIGLLIPEPVARLFNDAYFPPLAEGVASACHDLDLYMALLTVNEPADPEARGHLYKRIFTSGYHDGIVMASSPRSDVVTKMMIDFGVTFVLAGRQLDYPDLPCVDVDNVGGARMAVEYLVSLGHCSIGTIAGPAYMSAGVDRLDGFRSAMAGHGLTIDPAHIIEGDFTEQSGFTAGLRLAEKPPTALFVASDMMAAGAMRAFAARGLRVPDDVSIVSFDGFPLSATTHPALTTITQPVVECGRRAVEMLIGLIDTLMPRGSGPAADGDNGAPRLVLPVALTVRESTCRRDTHLRR